MNHKELVRALAEASDVKQKDVDAVLKSFADVVYKNDREGEVFKIPYFCAFKITEKQISTSLPNQKYKGRRKIVKCRVYKSFRSIINAS